MNFPIGVFKEKMSNHVVGKMTVLFLCEESACVCSFRMTYTKHRSTQETLQTLDSLELDTVRSSQYDLLKKFNYENDVGFSTTGQLSALKRARMIIWQIFEEPRSSTISRVNSFVFKIK